MLLRNSICPAGQAVAHIYIECERNEHISNFEHSEKYIELADRFLLKEATDKSVSLSKNKRGAIMSETKNPNYFVLVNEDNRLPNGFEDTVELIPSENIAGNQFQIEKKTYDAFCALREDVLKNDGIQTVLLGSYRTIEQQEKIFKSNFEKFGLDYAKKYVAKPGYSEHHTGLAIDVGILLEGKLYRTKEELLSVDYLFEIIQKKLPRYGFILRYPRGKEAITKIAYEPWHYRYIDSLSIAQEITDKGMCFEEYCQKV
ncbi:MAG: M15 family metallopeptidase [Clostridia bacterium]|nr:M15 family metallopeptidase [Clostridia bacterium]